MKTSNLIIIALAVLIVSIFFWATSYTIVIVGIVYGSIISYQLREIKNSIDKLHNTLIDNQKKSKISND